MDTMMLRPDGLDYKFSIQLCIAECRQSPEEVGNYIDQHFWGNCLHVAREEHFVSISINTDKPWEILQYCASLGEVFNIVICNRTFSQKR